jgi:hypothetical protein
MYPYSYTAIIEDCDYRLKKGEGDGVYCGNGLILITNINLIIIYISIVFVVGCGGFFNFISIYNIFEHLLGGMKLSVNQNKGAGMV